MQGAWTAKLKANGAADCYIYALHNRLSQLMSDAVHDGLLTRSPCSRRTSPPAGRPRQYVATTEQVFALCDAFAEHQRPAVLLGALAGLRTAEVVGLRVVDVDVEHGSATTTLNTYSHLWPDRDEQTRAAVGAVLRVRQPTKINDAESRLRAKNGPVTRNCRSPGRCDSDVVVHRELSPRDLWLTVVDETTL